MTPKQVKEKLSEYKWAKKNLEMFQKSFFRLGDKQSKSEYSIEGLNVSLKDFLGIQVSEKLDVDTLLEDKFREVQKLLSDIEKLIENISEREKCLIRNRVTVQSLSIQI